LVAALFGAGRPPPPPRLRARGDPRPPTQTRAREGRDVTRRRKWLLGSGLVACLALVGAGAYVATHFTELKAAYAARQLRQASTDDDRKQAAAALANLGEPGLTRLVGFVTTGDEAQRSACVAALDKLLAESPEGDARAVAVGTQLQAAFGACDADGQRAILSMLPAVLAKTGDTHSAKCREVVASGLKMTDPAARVSAIRLAIHPEVRMRPDVVPLLNAPEAEVRRAALVAVAMTTESELIGDEELFRWLHDPDEGVRSVCHDALVARGRTDTEIMLGGRLVAPDARERLKLLLDLRYDDDVADPEPWLERLSRDPEPAVRAGAARVAIEVTTRKRQTCPVWVSRVAETDADATVRRVAAYFHRQAAPRPDPNVRPAGKQ
jgi:hypothetical protein